MANRLDHLVIAGGDLDHLTSWWEALTGLAPTPGGAHDGMGTRNALVGLGPTTYLELIGPDPEQPDHQGPRPFGVNDLGHDETRLVTFAIAVDDLDAAAATITEAGFDPGPIRSMSRVRPDGVRLEWRLATPSLEPYAGLQPFTIEWGPDTPHPASDLPGGLTLVGLRLSSPRADELDRLAQRLEVPIGVEEGSKPKLLATVEGPNGPITLGES